MIPKRVFQESGNRFRSPDLMCVEFYQEHLEKFENIHILLLTKESSL
jgi:hypothetical protein